MRKKRSCIEELGQGASRKLGEAPPARDILHVVKRPTLLVLAGLALGGPATAAPMVVIDPGHGGSNSGAQSHGRQEKHLTLAIAEQVAARLRDRAIDVELTRTTDRTMTLRQRVAVADRRVADLFISIHANASELRTQQGFETYVLTPRAVDIDGRALRSDTTTPRPGVDPDIALVLDDVERG
ncbi:MAG: N-acetylmuramoyl-L-alanine amidase, partial [Kofleriaceae bacterium]